MTAEATKLVETMLRRAEGAATGIQVRSALNPMLYLCAIGSPVCIGAAYLFSSTPWIAGLFAVTAVLPIVATVAGFAYFSRRDPGRLQSEDFQLRQETIRVLAARAPADTIDANVLQQLAIASSREDAESSKRISDGSA